MRVSMSIPAIFSFKDDAIVRVEFTSPGKPRAVQYHCFAKALGMWREDWGFELSETFRVTPAGPPEILTRFPRDMVVKA